MRAVQINFSAWIRAVAFAVALVLAATPAGAQPNGVDSAGQSTVRVALILENGTERALFGTGSGFVVGRNLIITNAHVVAPVRDQPNMGLVVIAPGGDGPAPARIIAFSALDDLALLEAPQLGALPPIAIATVEPRPGDSIVALGYPDVDDLRRAADDLVRPIQPSRTTGSITSLRDTAPTGDPIPTINHEATISSGSSGGPLLDECGRVIGVNTWHARARDTFESRAVATRVTQLLDFLADSGIRPLTTGERCLTVAERVEAERASTVDALATQNRALASKLEAADRLTRLALIILLGGTAALMVAVVVLGAIVIGRRHPPPVAAGQAVPEPALEPHAVHLHRGAPGVLVVVAGATVAAVLVAAAGVALWRMRDLGATEPAPQAFAGDQTCTLDRSASRGAGEDDGDLSFAVTGNLCVNGRTLYAPARDRDSYQRTLLNTDTKTLDVLTLDPRGRQFRRDRYALSQPAFDQANAALGATAIDGCAGDEASETVVRRNETMLRFAEGRPQQHLVWRCQPRN